MSTSSWSCWFSAQWTPLPTISPCRIARVIEIILSCWSNSSHRLQCRMQNIVVKSIPNYGILLNELTCSEVLNILTPHSDTKFILQLKEDLIFKNEQCKLKYIKYSNKKSQFGCYGHTSLYTLFCFIVLSKFLKGLVVKPLAFFSFKTLSSPSKYNL